MGSCTILGLHAFVCVVITLIRGSHGKLYNLRSSCLCLCSDYIDKGQSWEVVQS